MRKILGYTLLALPFVVFGIFATIEMGILVTLSVFGVTALMILIVFTGSYLIRN